MKKLLGLLALILLAAPAVAQDRTMPGRYEASPATIVEGQWAPLLVDTSRRLITVSAGSAAGTSQQVVGNVAGAATDSGNPVKIGCVFSNNAPPTYTAGQRTDCQADSRGSLQTVLMNQNGTTPVNTVNVTTDANASGTGLRSNSQGLMFNGSTWDREFTCPSSAVVNVSAAATTQLVALASSQIIRVCSFLITGDTAATVATFVYGTGANCATGQTALTGAMRMVDEGNLSLSAAQGSLFRTAASNALCLTATTGAVTGVITYAQF